VYQWLFLSWLRNDLALRGLHLGYVLLERLRSQIDAEGGHEASQRDVPGDQRPVAYRGERASDQGVKPVMAAPS
jgi:hypothetical protein